MVETIWTDNIHVEHRSGYVNILFVTCVATTLLYDDDALMIQLVRLSLTLNKFNVRIVEGIIFSL